MTPPLLKSHCSGIFSQESFSCFRPSRSNSSLLPLTSFPSLREWQLSQTMYAFSPSSPISLNRYLLPPCARGIPPTPSCFSRYSPLFLFLSLKMSILSLSPQHHCTQNLLFAVSTSFPCSLCSSWALKVITHSYHLDSHFPFIHSHPQFGVHPQHFTVHVLAVAWVQE